MEPLKAKFRKCAEAVLRLNGGGVCRLQGTQTQHSQGEPQLATGHSESRCLLSCQESKKPKQNTDKTFPPNEWVRSVRTQG